jgi:hypothetical protein
VVVFLNPDVLPVLMSIPKKRLNPIRMKAGHFSLEPW